jgi:beta-lactamase class A
VLTRRRMTAGLVPFLAGESPRRSEAAEASLATALMRIEAASGGRLGVGIVDTASGARHSHRGAERFPMCSTFKLLACGALLARVDAGKDHLDRIVRFAAGDVVSYSPVTGSRAGGNGMSLSDLCAAALTQSDNTAGNLILRSLGGPSAVTAYARTLGDQVTRLDRFETELNTAIPGDPRDTTTPLAIAENLRALTFGDRLATGSRDQLTAWLLACQTGGAKLRAGLPVDWRIGDKTGGGAYGTNNDIAVLWPPGRAPLVVSVYLTETKAGFDAGNATIASVGRAVRDALAA